MYPKASHVQTQATLSPSLEADLAAGNRCCYCCCAPGMLAAAPEKDGLIDLLEAKLLLAQSDVEPRSGPTYEQI